MSGNSVVEPMREMDEADREWPLPGQKLLHRFTKKSNPVYGKEVVAEVVSVDRDNCAISVRVGEKIYPSLSKSASAITGKSTNGWIFWGLKKQTPRKKKAK